MIFDWLVFDQLSAHGPDVFNFWILFTNESQSADLCETRQVFFANIKSGCAVWLILGKHLVGHANSIAPQTLVSPECLANVNSILTLVSIFFHQGWKHERDTHTLLARENADDYLKQYRQAKQCWTCCKQMKTSIAIQLADEWWWILISSFSSFRQSRRGRLVRFGFVEFIARTTGGSSGRRLRTVRSKQLIRRIGNQQSKSGRWTCICRQARRRRRRTVFEAKCQLWW